MQTMVVVVVVYTVDGQVYTWGYDDDGRLGHGAVGHMVRQQAVILRACKARQP